MKTSTGGGNRNKKVSVGGSYNHEPSCGTVSTSSTITPFRKPQEEQCLFPVVKGSEDVATEFFLGRGLPRTVTVQVHQTCARSPFDDIFQDPGPQNIILLEFVCDQQLIFLLPFCSLRRSP